MTITGPDILHIIRQTLSVSKPVPLHEPFFNGNEKQYLINCLETRFVSSVGEYVDRFETALANFTQSGYAVATVNGTAALHVCLLLAGVRPNDEVLVPSLTFAATANAVVYCNAVPHFIDADPQTLGVNIEKLADYLQTETVLQKKQCIHKKTQNVIRAIVPVHVFGHPVDMDELNTLCRQHHIAVVEDAAESLGSFYKNRHTGNFSRAAAISFNGNKTITTGGGGAILLNDETLAQKAKHLTTTAKANKGIHHFHDQTGFNYRMPNINAALGLAQLEQLPDFLACKRQLAGRYRSTFEKADGCRILWEPPYARSNFWLNTLILETSDPDTLESVCRTLSDNGISARPVWTPMHQLPMYSNCPKMDLSATEKLKHQIINLPSSINL